MMRDDRSYDEKLKALAEVVGDVDRDVQIRALRQHNGDLDKAVISILSGDVGDMEPTRPNTPMPGLIPADKDIIDLTLEDDELNRAIELSKDRSMETSKTIFSTSEREPTPNWQLVPSNVPAPLSQEDTSLRQAIAASLQEQVDSESGDTVNIEPTVRERGRPVALVSSASRHPCFYATLILHALFFVPSVKRRVAALDIQDTETDSLIYHLSKLFTNLDLAQISVLTDDEVLPLLHAQPWKDGLEHPGDLAKQFLTRFGETVEPHLGRPANSRLFKFSTSKVTVRTGRMDGSHEEGFVVSVDLSTEPTVPNSLVVRLRHMLNTPDVQDVILEPSEVVAFSIQPPFHANQAGLDPFSFPKYVYMDLFLARNFELARNKRKEEENLTSTIKNLNQRKQSLTRFNGKDTIKNFEATIHYYESLASGRNDPSRQLNLDVVGSKLKTSLHTLKQELSDIDTQLEEVQGKLSTLFDCPELQELEYELRAVIVYTGLPGRKNTYSYVQDEGTWWKVVDSSISEVLEEVAMGDPTGLHLGGGPFMLIYSRRLTDEETATPLQWPAQFVNEVELNNRHFLASRQEEVDK